MESISLFPFGGNERILDIGSGDGVISSLLAKRAHKGSVLGIDIDPEMVAYARATSNRANLAFEVADAEEMAFESEFDLATIFFTYEWLSHREPVIRGCYRSLVPGGRLWIVVPVDMPKELKESAELIAGQDKWREFFDGFVSSATFPSMRETEELLLHSGFGPIASRVRKKEMLFPTREAFHRTLLATFPYLDPLPDERKEEFITDLLDRYVVYHPIDPQGRLLCPLEIAQWIAVKRDPLNLLHQ